MECVCGYNVDYNIECDKDFIQSELKVSFEKDGNYHKIITSETVYICPECGTLKINI